ncbi:MAG: DNA replication and repair protein RecF [Candidatus Homeothermus sp.]|nr:DNA replication and repair protein RecF [Candidatus Homeothermus sp.]
MILKSLKICNFKNISEAALDFSPKVNCFLGNNGMGKSNLLDAIYYLSFCKSFTGMTDAMLIRRGEEFTMLDARYDRRGVEEELSLGMAKGRRKSLKRMGKEYQRLSTHIGAFPLVLSSPHDIDLIRGTGEERRRLIDMLISQGDPVYLDRLIRYNRALEQRNKMLRDRIADPALYLAVEMQMDTAAAYLHATRSKWIGSLSEIFDRYYRAIGGDDEHVTLTYRCSLADDGTTTLCDALDRSRHRDETVCHTTVGPHRDDIDMLLDGMPMRRAGSQGQCKTFVIALRLAQYEFLRDTSGMFPMLLLDDIFDKLDASRVEHIMEIVTGEGFGQIFITDTNRTHLDEIMSRTTGDYRMWLVESGTLSTLNHR